jgi:hypothetical protein
LKREVKGQRLKGKDRRKVKGEREKAEGQGLKDYLKAGVRSQESEDRRKRLAGGWFKFFRWSHFATTY